MQPDARSAHLGYLVSQQGGTPAEYELKVIVRSRATGTHFDPEELRATVASGENKTETLSVRHPFMRSQDFRACAGRVVLVEHRGKTTNFFTFGGELAVQSFGDEYTYCLLTSPAPIIHMVRWRADTVLLAIQGEVLLAQRRAAWAGNQGGFDERLATADPLDLYIACLEWLRRRFTAFPCQVQDGTIQDFSRFLRARITRLRREGRWPATLPDLEELL